MWIYVIGVKRKVVKIPKGFVAKRVEIIRNGRGVVIEMRKAVRKSVKR